MSINIYVADDEIRPQLLTTIEERLPEGWRLIDAAQGATALLTENTDITPALIKQAGPSLRLIARLDTGHGGVAQASVPVVNLPNTALVGVAEHALALILVLSRRLLMVARKTRQEEWLPDRSEPLLTTQTDYTYNWIGLEEFGTLYGKKAGLVGLGVIGRAVAARLNAFGVRVFYTKRQRLPPQEEARLKVQWRDLDDLLRESDFVSLHLRFQEGPGGNDKQFGTREFELMKPTAFFINTARGRLVDEEALVSAIKSGQIAGAGLDVFRYEPLPPEHPLLALAGDNVILTPHVAGAPVTEAWQTIAEELIAHTEAALAAAGSQ